MKLSIESVHLGSVIVLAHERLEDERGFFMETFRADHFRELGLPTEFMQDNLSCSSKHVRAGQVGLPAPLSRVTVVIREGTQAFSTTTDSQGQYAFKDVAPGRYTLTVSELPGVDPIPHATIQIKGPGACVEDTVTAVRRPPR
jgi:hypothetical protein